MDTIKNKELEKTYIYHKFISDYSIYIKTQISARKNSGDFLATIKFPFIGEIKNEKSLDKIFDDIDEKVSESFFIALVASFEKILFNKFGNTYGEIKKLVKEKYVSPKPMHKYGESFIKDISNTDSLAALKNIIVHQLSAETQKQFESIIEHRNYLAHGKRFGKAATILEPEDVLLILDEILEVINER